MRREENLVLKGTTNTLLKVEQTWEVVGEELFEFDFDKHVVIVGIRGKRNEVIAGEFGELHQNLLNLDREDVDATEHDHIVGTTSHAVDTDVIASAGASATQYAGEVTSAIANQWHSLATNGGENKFADLSIRHRLQGLGIDNFDNVVVFPEMQTILFLAFETYAWATHLRHTERVVCLHTKHVLDAFALLLRVRFSTNGKHLELGVLAWIDTLFLHDFVKTGHITWYSMKCSGAKIADELDLTK